MEQVQEHKRNMLKYALPIIGAAVPVATMLIRRAMTSGMLGETKEEKLLKQSNVDLQHAMHTALKYVPGIPVEVELEEDHGLPIWEVEVVPKGGGPVREVLIDARSGDLLQMKAEFEGESKKK